MDTTQEEQFRTLLEHTPDIVSRFDPSFRFLYISPAVERHTGIRPETFLGKRHAEAGIDEGLSARLESVLAEIFATGENRAAEFELISPKGELRYFHGLGVPERGPDGHVETVLTIVRDISEVKRTEERQRLAVDAGNVGLWDWDIMANKVVWSERVYEFHGVKPGEFGGSVEEFAKLVHPDDLPQVSERIERALRGETGYEVEFRAVRPGSGEVRWLATRARVFRDGEGRPVRMIGSTLDITDRKQLTEALLDSEDHYRHTVELSAQIPWTASAEGQIQDVSPQWLTLTGLTREQALTTGWTEVPYAEDLPRMLAGWSHSLATGQPFDMEHRIRVADGSVRWMRTRARPRRDAAGRIVRWYGATEDIEDRKQFEERLRVSEERYRFLAEAMPQFVMVAGPRGHAEYLNDYWYAYTGAGRDQPMKETWPQVAHPEDLPRVTAKWREARAAGTEFVVETRVRRGADGSYRWFLARYRPLREGGAEVTRWLGTAIDIHDRREAEAALRESEERFRRIVETATEGIWIVDPGTRTTFVNQRMADLLGYERDEMLGRSCFDFLHPEDQERGREGVELLKLEEAAPKVYRAQRKDGRTVWVEFTAALMRDAEGKITGILGMCTDVTERRTAEEALRRSEERYRSLTTATTAVVWMTNAQGAFDSPQESWERYTGQGWSEHRGFGWARMLHRDDRARLLADWNTALRDGVHYGSYARLWHAGSGQYRHVTVKAVAMPDSEGVVREWIGVIEDVHERRLAEQAVQETNDALSRANAALEQFAYAAAHDLQEPARNIAVFTQLLARRYEDKFDAQGEDFLKVITEGARRMQNLIQDLLSYTRATDDRGAAELETDASLVMEKVVQDLRTAIELAHGEIVWDPLPLVAVREAHLLQLLENLISNGLKYRAAEAPKLRVTAQQDRAEWRFTVQDNGQGIAAEHHARIFRVFKRLHGDEVPGTGIGLAICERIVTHYGGRIWVESEPGRGAAFHFTLPDVRGQE